VFLDNVRVTEADVLGQVGDGWTVMRDALAYERVGIARYARCESLLARLQTALEAEGLWEELAPSLRSRWVRAIVNLRVARLLAYTAVAQQNAGIDPAAAAAARIATTTCDQTVAELLVEAAGSAALDAGYDAPIHGAIDDHWRYAQAATVSSGTIEVQRILVARSVLGSSR
jgi:alkylation response protein AidB-like acyl-CoA dehydrogenase